MVRLGGGGGGGYLGLPVHTRINQVYPSLFIFALFILQAIMENNDNRKEESDDSKKKLPTFFVFSAMQSHFR